jgi:hypothetical protein
LIAAAESISFFADLKVFFFGVFRLRSSTPFSWKTIFVACTLSLLPTYLFWLVHRNGLIPIDGWFPGIFTDYRNLWIGGLLWRADDFVTLTSPADFNLFRASYFTFDSGHVWSYPLHFLLLTFPFSYLPFIASALLWLTLGYCLYLFSLARLGFNGAAVIALTVLSSGFVVNTYHGQYAAYFAPILWASLGTVSSSPILAGLFFGILSTKPQLLVFPGLLLLFSRKFTTIAASLACAGALVGITTLLIGIEPWKMLLFKMGPQQTSSMFNTWALQPYSLTWYSAVWRLTESQALGYAVQAVVTAAALAATIVVARSRRSWRERIDVVLILMAVGLPYLLIHELLLILPVLLKVALSSGPYTRAHRVTALAIILTGLIGILLLIVQLFPLNQVLLLIFAVQQLRHFFALPVERSQESAAEERRSAFAA